MPQSMGQQVKLHRRLFFELVVTSKTIQWNKETKAEDLLTGQCSKESGHAPTAALQLSNFLFNQEKGARYTAETAIGTESQHEISADKSQIPVRNGGVCVFDKRVYFFNIFDTLHTVGLA